MMMLTADIMDKIVRMDDEFTENVTVLEWTRTDEKSSGNFNSNTSRLFLTYAKLGGEIEKKSFFLKVPHTSPLHKYNTKYAIEQREYIVYTQILPTIRGNFAPKFYHVDENYSLILEDLSASDYRLANRIEKLDFQHCQLVFKCLAQFHAYSVKLEQTKKLAQIFKQDTFFLSTKPECNHLRPVFAKAYDCFLRTFDQELVGKYSAKLHHFKENMLHRIAEEVQSGNFKVLNHGDIWTTNIIFKYDQFGSVEHCKLIDFQLCRWASPAFDILHFTVTSMKFTVFQRYFDLLLEIYLETLNNTLKFLGCEIYRINDLRKDIDRTYGFTILAFTILTPVIMADSDDPVDLADILKDPIRTNDALEKAYRKPNYQNLARQWFLYLVKKGIFVE